MKFIFIYKFKPQVVVYIPKTTIYLTKIAEQVVEILWKDTVNTYINRCNGMQGSNGCNYYTDVKIMSLFPRETHRKDKGNL